MMFKEFPIARFMIAFIVFMLAYMVASWSSDTFFHVIVAGMFILTLRILYELRQGQLEELAKRDAAHAEQMQEMQAELDGVHFRYNLLVRSIEHNEQHAAALEPPTETTDEE